MPVIDAGVYIAISKKGESEHESSVQWIVSTRAMGEKVVAPNILLADAWAGISRGMGDSAEAADIILKRLRNSKVINLISITVSLAIRAAEIGLQHKIRGCDAIYVAVAEYVGYTLVTLDNQQKERGKAVFETATPQEWLDNLKKSAILPLDPSQTTESPLR